MCLHGVGLSSSKRVRSVWVLSSSLIMAVRVNSEGKFDANGAKRGKAVRLRGAERAPETLAAAVPPVSFGMYFVAHEHSGWPSAQTSSGTTQIKLCQQSERGTEVTSVRERRCPMSENMGRAYS